MLAQLDKALSLDALREGSPAEKGLPSVDEWDVDWSGAAELNAEVCLPLVETVVTSTDHDRCHQQTI